MPSFSATANSFTFDGKAYSKAFNKAVESLFRQAGRKFLQTALPQIPIRTGFVAGAFTVLSDALGGTYGGRTAASSAIGTLNSLERKLTRVADRLRDTNVFLRDSPEVDKLTSPVAKIQHAKLTARKVKLEGILKSIGKKLEKIGAKTKKNPMFGFGLAASEIARNISPEQSAKKQPTVGHPKANVNRGRERRSETRTSKFPGAPKGEQKVSKETVPSPLMEYYKPASGKKVLKTMRSGRQFAEFSASDQVLQTGSKQTLTIENAFASKQELQKGYFFSFKIDISYFNINDEHSNRFTPFTPWKSFANGRRAFIEHMNNNLKLLPNVLSFLIETEITLNLSGSVSTKTKKLVI